MTVTDRFLKYVTFDTQSSETTGTTPSTPGQLVFAEALVKELKEIGLEDITLDDKSYLMATLPANTAKAIPTIGFIAHLDTSPDMSGKDVQPRIVTYKGGDIVLCAEENIVLSPLMFPELNDYKEQDIIVTNGKTLLGADDKGGVAAIISAMKYLKDHPEIEHGKIRIGFTPDEEIGAGADHFDVEKFGCEWAYTIDGGQIGELEYENFNAAGAKVLFKGLNVHPGYAKDKMLNASLLAVEFASWLPAAQRPEHTDGYDGFFHLTAMGGTVEEASLSYIIRDHVRTAFEQKKELLQELVKRMNEMHPGSTTLELRDQYYNMREVVEPKKYIIDLAFDAMTAAGVTPLVKPIRGGTDGARLSFMGLPCPNLFAGGLNFHGRYEFLPVKSLEKSMETIIKIAELLAQKS
ncbi:peptidase T [Parabacteroides acidifaciens]|uniref:Peptidase T n=1 Tax=Parabacteroides acidifaciens TaxID=2290935 RepID=A0A3D8HEK4_9BACT|nr:MULTISPECIES: peptidase T [Parabacteroides]MBC8601943.1 peptidase T [Parabacteroides acidifaciens]RDU49399.1 peptidase T [Parabacteroides acidifaciens]RHO69422.1 peptidase T [Parabacteroides sp. AF48-14]RHR58318.1 peptidase T [Parabacteroides sp. AF17-28]